MSRQLRIVELSGATRTIRVEAPALASGADGAIHRIEGEPALMAKLYHEPGKDPDRLKKLQAMLANPPELPFMETNGRRYIQIAWPVAWLEEDGVLVGFVMPAVELSQATALENFLAKKTRALAGLPESYGYRLTAAANLAAVVTELHAHGHHIIDLKPINLNVYTDTFYMAVLDCDGFSVRGDDGRRFPAHQFSDGYICPEALQHALPPQELGEDQDRFALAVILFQLLNQGLHPYQGVPVDGGTVPPTTGERIAQELYAYGLAANPSLRPSPWSIHGFFDDETRVLFDRAFTTRHDRPSAHEWHRHLEPYADIVSGKVHICAENREHVHFSKGCPWCSLENRAEGSSRHAHAQAGQRPPAPWPGGGENRRGHVIPQEVSKSFENIQVITATHAHGKTARPLLQRSLVAITFALVGHQLFSSGIVDMLRARLFARHEVEVSDVRQEAAPGKEASHYVEFTIMQPTTGRWRVVSVQVEQAGMTVANGIGYASDFRVSGNNRSFRIALDKALGEGKYVGKARLVHYSDSGIPTLVEHEWDLR